MKTPIRIIALLVCLLLVFVGSMLIYHRLIERGVMDEIELHLPSVFLIVILSIYLGQKAFRTNVKSQKRVVATVKQLFVVTISGFIIVTAIFFIAMGLHTRSIRGKVHRINCARNMEKIGMVLQMYSAENDGMFPGSLDVLWRGNNPRLRYGQAYLCPAGGSSPARPNSDYIYVGSNTSSSDPNSKDIRVRSLI